MTCKFVVPCWGCVSRFKLMFPLIETHPPTFSGDDLLLLLLLDCGLNVNTICPPEVCVKFPETTILDPEEMFKLALLFKFPSINVVVFPLKTISPLFVIVPFFGVKLHLHSPPHNTQHTFTWLKSTCGAFWGQLWQFATWKTHKSSSMPHLLLE